MVHLNVMVPERESLVNKGSVAKTFSVALRPTSIRVQERGQRAHNAPVISFEGAHLFLYCLLPGLTSNNSNGGMKEDRMGGAARRFSPKSNLMRHLYL